MPSCELAETSNFDNLASFYFPEIELEHEYDHDLPPGDSILFTDSIMTPVSPPDFTFPESTLDPVPIHHMNLNHPFLMIILNLTNCAILKVPWINWQVLIFMILS